MQVTDVALRTYTIETVQRARSWRNGLTMILTERWSLGRVWQGETRSSHPLLDVVQLAHGHASAAHGFEREAV
jgi:hypothetical protein